MRSDSESLPILAITMGDPAGIGPEITLKALSGPKVYQLCRPLVVGDAALLRHVRPIVGAEHLQVHTVKHPNEARFESGTVDVLQVGDEDLVNLPAGQVSAEAGEAAFLYVQEAIRLALAGAVDGTVTNPLNKEAINRAGHHYAGHTEIYAALTGAPEVAMMLAHGDLRVIHVSTHVSLRQACDLVKKERVLKVIRIADDACRRLGIAQPRVAVAGLNPHSGESGLFGHEDAEEIVPAIEAARALGILAEGPVPPDTVFSKAQGGLYDIVVAMYHDQGHIPLKLVGFQLDKQTGRWTNVSGVNITLGLPIIRTSVDHGTAFDQARKGTATELSLLDAISYAAILARTERGKQP